MKWARRSARLPSADFTYNPSVGRPQKGVFTSGPANASSNSTNGAAVRVVPSVGGVVSTGGAGIMDVGFLRMPFRGWFNIDTGEDQELNGAIPDVIIWPTPGETKDRQIERGVELLLKDVEAWKNKPAPRLRKATER